MKTILIVLFAFIPGWLLAQDQSADIAKETANQIRIAEQAVISHLKIFKDKVIGDFKNQRTDYFEKQTVEAVSQNLILKRMAPQKGKPEEASGIPGAYRALVNIEFARLKYTPDKFDLASARFNSECYVALEPDSVEAHLLLAKVLEHGQETKLKLAHLKTVFNLDVHSFDQYYKELTLAKNKSEFLNEVGSKIEALLTGGSFDSNEVGSFAETIQKIVNARFELEGDVSKEVRLFEAIKPVAIAAEFYSKNRINNLEINLGIKQSHIHFSRGEIEKQLEVLNEIVAKYANPRIDGKVKSELVQVMIHHPEFAMQAREIFDPFYRHNLDTGIARVIADHLADRCEHLEVERRLRFRAYSANQFEDAIKLMRSHLGAGRSEVFSALRAIEENRKSTRLYLGGKKPKKDERKPWLDPDAVDSLPIPLRGAPAEIDVESLAQYYFLRGRLEMQLEKYGVATHYLGKAIEVDGEIPDVKKYLDECTAKVLDDGWAGPSEIFPEGPKRSVGYSAMKSKLLEILNLEPSESTAKVKAELTPVEKAIQVVSHGEVNWQTKRHKEAVKFLKQTVAGKKTGDPEIHLALAYNEMGRFGSRTDTNFDAEYVLRHLGCCKTEKRPLSIEIYRAHTTAYRRLGLAKEYLQNIREMVEDHPKQIWSLHAANIAVNRRDDNPALVQQECSRLKKLFDEKPETSGSNSFTNQLNRLARETDDPGSVLAIYEAILDRNNSHLPNHLKQTYEQLKSRNLGRDEKADQDISPWATIAWALENEDRQLFRQGIKKAAGALLPSDISVENLIKLVESSVELEFAGNDSRSIARILERILNQNEKRYSSIFWVTRSKEKVRLQRLLAKFLIESGDKRKAVGYLEAILKTHPDDEGIKKLLEDCLKPTPPRRGRRSSLG